MMPLKSTFMIGPNLKRSVLLPVTLVAILISFNGCTVGPDYGAVSSSRISDHFSASHVNSQFVGAPTGEIPVEQWWQSFADPILNDLVSRAMHQSLDLQGAYERIVEARANFHLQTGQLLPDGSTNSGYEYLKRSPNARPFVGSNGDPFNLFTQGLSVAWELDLFGRIKRSIEAAEASVELQEFDLESIRQVLVADIASSYLRVRLLQQQISLTQQSIGLQSQTVDMIEKRTTAGASTELDRAQTKSFLRRSEALLASLEQQLVVEFNQLSLLLGESPGEQIIQLVGVQSLPHIPMIPATGIPADLLRRRPDVRREERAVAAASARIGIAEADLYPRLSLLGDISLSAMSPSQLFQTDSLAFSLGPSFSWNILHFGRIFSNIEIFESQFRQALIAYEQTVLQAVREVEDGLTQHRGAYQQWNSFSAAIEEDKLAVELSLARYEVGKVNFQRVLDAQQQLLLDQQQQATQQAAAIEQLIRTHKALGGGWQAASPSSCAAGGCSTCGCSSGGCSDGGCTEGGCLSGGCSSGDCSDCVAAAGTSGGDFVTHSIAQPFTGVVSGNAPTQVPTKLNQQAIPLQRYPNAHQRYSNAHQLYPPIPQGAASSVILR